MFAGVDAGTGAGVVVVAAGGGYTATQIQLPAGMTLDGPSEAAAEFLVAVCCVSVLYVTT